MTRERELLETALGILEDYEWGYGGDHHKSPEASILNDIRKLLAQPEQEPSSDDYMYNKLKEDYEYLLSHPPKREPLSDEAVCEILIKKEWKGFVELVRLIEKAHGIGGGNE